METNSIEHLEQQNDDYLYNFMTENDSSQIKWKAAHILEKRRLKLLVYPAKHSAVASIVSAIIALISLLLNFYLIYSKNV